MCLVHHLQKPIPSTFRIAIYTPFQSTVQDASFRCMIQHSFVQKFIPCDRVEFLGFEQIPLLSPLFSNRWPTALIPCGWNSNWRELRAQWVCDRSKKSPSSGLDTSLGACEEGSPKTKPTTFVYKITTLCLTCEPVLLAKRNHLIDRSSASN